MKVLVAALLSLMTPSYTLAATCTVSPALSSSGPELGIIIIPGAQIPGTAVYNLFLQQLH